MYSLKLRYYKWPHREGKNISHALVFLIFVCVLINCTPSFILFHCWYNQSLRNKWTHKEHRYKTEAIIFWSYSLSITTQVLWQDKPAWARLSAQSRRYEAVLEMQPRQNSTVWMVWYTKMSPILVWRRNRWNELSSLDAQNSSYKDIWAFLYIM